jgi:RAB protein geranylgeranyltransferase component A
MLRAEDALTPSVWVTGFKSVNLNPKEKLPIEVWLSKISDHLVAAGEEVRYIKSGYNPSKDEVAKEYNLAHLRALRKATPALYNTLSDEHKREALNMFQARDTSAYQSAALTKTIKDSAAVEALDLLHKNNLHRWFKFISAYHKAVDLGLLSQEDLVVSDLHLKRCQKLETIEAQNRLCASSEHGIGK